MEPLSVNHLVHQIAPYRLQIFIWIATLPLLALLGGRLLRPMSRRFSGCFLALTVWLSVLPGIAASLAVAYVFFFTGTNLVNDMDVVLHFGPIASMMGTILAATRVLPAREIPGLKRIGGLFLASGVGSGVLFALSRTHIATYFWLGERAFFYMIAGVLLLAFIAYEMMFGGTEASEQA